MRDRVDNRRNRRILYAVSFVVAGAVVGGLIHNPFDPQRYAKGAIGILQGMNIYELRGVVYPPPLYAFSSLLLYIASLFTNVQTNSYVAIATFVGIGAATQALSYHLGVSLVPDAKSIQWAVASLFNPFVIYVLILFGQMESFIVLGIVGVIYAERTARWEVGGALLAVAASVKIYPAILFLPFVWRNREHTYRIIRGAAPIGVLTVVLMIPYFPESFMIFLSAFWGIRGANALYILSLSTVPSWAVSVVFLTTFVLAGVLSAVVETDRHVGYLLTLVPVVLFYPDLTEYRWLPLAVCSLLVGYLQSPSTEIQDVCRRYGWLWILLGTVVMIVGSLRSLYAGDPWLVPTTNALPELSVVFAGWYPSLPFGSFTRHLPFDDRTLVEIVRTGVDLVFIASVVHWCRLVYRNSRLRPL